MSKFIETDKLLAEIKTILKSAENEEKEAFAKLDAEGHLVAVTKTAICTKIVGVVASLRQEHLEADWEMAFSMEYATYHIPKFIRESISNGVELINFIYDTARHFYEFGLNARRRELTEEDLDKLVNEEFASRSRATEHGLEVAYNRAELSRFIKRMALLFTTKKEVQL